jgi:signal transduction histidine kinase
MSSASPIFDPDSGAFIGMLGIDSLPDQYYYDLASRVAVPILIALTASLLLWKIDNVRRKHDEITQLKSQFVSIASHELRSPLSGMMWAIQSLLKDEETTIKQAKLLEDMFKSTQSSLSTVNEILDMSVFERANVTKIQKVDMDLNIAMREVLKNLKLGASEKSIEIKTRNLDVAAPLEGDPGAIKRSLMNIVANALKYSPEHSTVSITYQRLHDKHIIKVADKGIGIPKRDIPKVLNGYFRAKNAVKIQSTGTGLGLYVSKLIIEKHKGEIELMSKEGTGTLVSLTLPAKITTGRTA